MATGSGVDALHLATSGKLCAVILDRMEELEAAIVAAHRADMALEDNRPGVKMMIDFARSAV